MAGKRSVWLIGCGVGCALPVLIGIAALAGSGPAPAREEAGRGVSQESRRARDLGLSLGALEPGPRNDLTDVAGVRVGHFTGHEGTRFHTGITAVLPHGGNLYLEKVPGAVFVGNGFGKLAGSTQVNELGEIETPILLTGTLSVPRVADGLLEIMLALPGMEEVRSLNPLVGETNDGWLSDIRARPLGVDEVGAALAAADGGPVVQGAVGAGSGTICFGFKGGIGSASRVLARDEGGWTVGVLVQSNFGGSLILPGLPREVDGMPLQAYLRDRAMAPGSPASSPGGSGDAPVAAPPHPDGSLMIVVATDAPLGHRNLKRLAARSLYGMARVGGSGSNGSGDYAIAFSAHQGLRLRPGQPAVSLRPTLSDAAMTPLFAAVVEATEEAILDSLFAAVPVHGHRGAAAALPVEAVRRLIQRGDP